MYRVLASDGFNGSRVIHVESGAEIQDVRGISWVHRVGELPKLVVEVVAADMHLGAFDDRVEVIEAPEG